MTESLISETLGASVYNLLKMTFAKDPNAEFKVAGSCGVALLQYIADVEASALSSQSLSLSEAIERGDRYERIADEHRSLIGELKPALSEAREEIERLRGAFAASNDDICQTLGKALGYPWFKDDQKNFPGATEANGVCVGDHVAESIAAEAANRFDALKADMAVVLRAELDRLEAAAPLNARETARYLMVERRLSALENCKPALADATNDPAAPSLSSLRKGAEDRETIARAIWKFERWPEDMTSEQQEADWRRIGPHFEECADAVIAALVSGSREDGDG